MPPADSSRDRWLDFPSLEGHVELSGEVVEAGRHSRGRVVLRNSGTEAIDLQTNSVLIATVLYLSAEVASRFSGPYLATGRMIHLNPGEEASVPLMFSTTQEKDGAEVALSPGDYLVKVDLPIFDRRSNGEDGMERSYLSMPFADLRLVRHQ